MDGEKRICRNCAKVKPVDEFSRNGVRNLCKACVAFFQRTRYSKNGHKLYDSVRLRELHNETSKNRYLRKLRLEIDFFKYWREKKDIYDERTICVC